MDIKTFCIVGLLSLCACQEKQRDNSLANSDSVVSKIDSTRDENGVNTEDTVSVVQTYSNARFKEVAVERTGEHKFTIKGKGQIFEANFGWVVEDGHEELSSGYQMTDAGAPEWGAFKFTIEVEKKRQNSMLTLILFETSAMDGSRQHELPISLE